MSEPRPAGLGPPLLGARMLHPPLPGTNLPPPRKDLVRGDLVKGPVTMRLGSEEPQACLEDVTLGPPSPSSFHRNTPRHMGSECSKNWFSL